MKQYEIRWADMPLPIGRRPVVLLSRTAAYAYLNKIIVTEVTTTIRNIPQELALGPAEGLPTSCVANLDNVHVIAKTLIGQLVGELSRRRHREMKRALGHALGWDELKTL